MGVFPTRVGVFPRCAGALRRRRGLPHTRGGVSEIVRVDAIDAASSPHAWGCFQLDQLHADVDAVFPTRVGVFLVRASRRQGVSRLPHTRGGVSLGVCVFQRRLASSPHAWGCFRTSSPSASTAAVFPTRVGVFLRRLWKSFARVCLPHTRGGVSMLDAPFPGIAWSSPHAWGCFSFLRARPCLASVFPTRVGVFLQWIGVRDENSRLPHTRGGVSCPAMITDGLPTSSPHAWGCFLPPAGHSAHFVVFPTRVGVFPGHGWCRPLSTGLPHTRGGVSSSCCVGTCGARSSPHAWGCFCEGIRRSHGSTV